MINKGLMSDGEISTLRKIFPNIYHYYIRIDRLRHDLSDEDLINVDISADIFNELTTMTANSDYILVLMSATQGNMVTDYRVYSSLKLTEIFMSIVNNDDEIQRQITNGKLYFINTSKSSFTERPDKLIALALEVERNQKGIPKYVTAHYGYSMNTTNQPDLAGTRRTRMHTSEAIRDGILTDSEKLTRGGNWPQQENLIRLVDYSESEGIITWDMVNTNLKRGGADLRSKYKVEKNLKYSIDSWGIGTSYPPITKSTLYVKRKYTFNFNQSKFDKYIGKDAQPAFFQKIRKFLNRRLEDDAEGDEMVELLTLSASQIDGSFGGNKNIFKNYFVHASHERVFLESINANLGMSQEYLNKIEEFLEKGLRSFQEARGRFKPLDRKFFENPNPEKEYERDIFYNNVYPYLNQALGGLTTGSGKRNYQPTRKSETINKALTQDIRDTITYLNSTDIEQFKRDVEGSNYKGVEVVNKYIEFINQIGEELAGSVTGENHLQVMSEEYAKELFDRLVSIGMLTRKEEFSLTQLPFYFLRLGMFGPGNSGRGITFNDFDSNLDNKYNKMFFILIDMFKQEIIVINYTTVNDPSRYSINFQDFDISIDLRNTVNRILREPENLVPGKGYVDVGENPLDDKGKYLHQPDEVALPFLSHERLTNQGIPDNLNTVHYEPLKVDRLTKKAKGHLLFWAKQTDFSSGSEVLAFFPFDSFYHDREGQGNNRMDVCFTPLDDPTATNEFIVKVKSAFLKSREGADGRLGLSKKRLRNLIFDELKLNPPNPSGPAACIYVGENMALGDSGTYFGAPSGKGLDTDFPFNFTAFGVKSVSELRTNTSEHNLVQTLTISEYNMNQWYNTIKEWDIEGLENILGKEVPFDPENLARTDPTSFRDTYGFRPDQHKPGHVWLMENGLMEEIENRLPFDDKAELKSFIKRIYKQYYNENPEKASATLMARRKD